MTRSPGPPSTNTETRPPPRDSRVVGRITTSSWSSHLDCGVAFVRMAEPGDWLGAEVSVATANGESLAAEVVSLPFFDPEKKIARGLS